MLELRTPAVALLSLGAVVAGVPACSLTDLSDLTHGGNAGGSGGTSTGGIASTGGIGGGGNGGSGGTEASGGTSSGGTTGGTGGEAPLGATALFWVDSGNHTVNRADADGGNVTPLITFDTSAQSSFLRSIAIDEPGEKLYFTDDARAKLLSANLDGSDVVDLITDLDNPVGLDLDLDAGKIYFVDQGAVPTIYRADLDGENLEPLITMGIQHPYGIVLDLTESKMYFVDNDADAIFRADLDGSNLEDIGVPDLIAPIELKLDPVERKLYWTDIGPPPKIRRANLDGSGVEDVISESNSPGFSAPIGLDVDEITRKLYFVDGGSGGLNVIQTSNLDGTNIRPLVVGLSDPRGIALVFEP